MVYTAAAMIARTHDGSETPARSRAAHCGAAIGRGQASRKRNRSVRRTCFSAVSATDSRQTRISPVAMPPSGGVPVGGALQPSAPAIQLASVSRCARPSR